MGRVHVWETKPAHKRCKEIERLQQSRTEIETETTDTQKKTHHYKTNVWGGCSRWFPEEEGGVGGFIANTLEGTRTGVLKTTSEKLGNKFGRFWVEKTERLLCEHKSSAIPYG